MLNAKFANRITRIYEIAEYGDPQLMVTEVFRDGTATVWRGGTAYIVMKNALFTDYANSDDNDIRDWTPVILAQEPGLYTGMIITAWGYGISETSDLILDRVKLKRGWREEIGL